jgi:predicted transcriptional regulator
MVVIQIKNLALLAGTIKSRRQIMMLTQEMLSDKSGVGQPMIAMVESGKRLPSLMNMVNILSALDLVLRVEESEDYLESF